MGYWNNRKIIKEAVDNGWKISNKGKQSNEKERNMREQELIWESSVLGKPVQMSARLVMIDKTRAEHLLKKQLPNQRTLSRSLVERLRQAMIHGEYIDSIVNPIFISNDGVTMDAQHRLTAVAESGIPAVFLVVKGLPKEAFVYFDQNKARSARDALKVRGIINPDMVASTAKLLHNLISENTNIPRNEVIDRIVRDHPALQDAVSKGQAMKEVTHGTPSVLAVLYFLYSAKYPEEARRFFQLLQHGSEEFVENPNHPVSKLRRKLLSEWKKDPVKRGSIPYVLDDSNTKSPTRTVDTRYKQMCYIHTAFDAFVKERRSCTWQENISIIEEISYLAKDVVTIQHSYEQENGGRPNLIEPRGTNNRKPVLLH